jgi:chemotaxis protein methyltransferase CheR
VQAEDLSDNLCQRLSALIARTTGLHFPPERYPDLQRGIAAAADEFGFQQTLRCTDWLLSTSLSPQQLRTLASHLTIGETYFFRERKTFEALAAHVLPELLRRRSANRRLRLWSAACCTGEEPYSLAILVQQLLGEAPGWDITILATDINERYLQRAAAGVYSEWSFRETPAGFKERYFTRGSDGRFTILPEIRERVRFRHRNLSLDMLPSMDPDLQAMDLILCRNVLMYFTPPHARRLVDELHRTLSDDGWLAVAACECSQGMFSRFTTVNLPGVVFYRKQFAAAARPANWELPPPAAEPDPVVPGELDMGPGSAPPIPAKELASMARALANQGQLLDALEWSERWIASDKIDAVAHYLHAMVLQEMGRREAARRSLQRVVYLQPRFALAHFALGNLARGDGCDREANRHFENALYVLRELPPGELLPESDGMTVEQLMRVIADLLNPND